MKQYYKEAILNTKALFGNIFREGSSLLEEVNLEKECTRNI